MKLLRRHFPKYISKWRENRKNLIFKKQINSIRGLCIGYLTRKHLHFLHESNLALQSSPCLYILREAKVIFLRAINQSKLLSLLEKHAIRDLLVISDKYRLIQTAEFEQLDQVSALSMITRNAFQLRVKVIAPFS